MRGVYTKAGTKGRLARGSSPHARGLPGHRDQRHGDLTDHPRMRGVYVGCQSLWRALAGSSPHARGLPLTVHVVQAHKRIIPACAGFTRPVTGSVCGMPDHPRMRGVYALTHAVIESSQGSSPHARGLQRLLGHLTELGGIIPACAGFTGPGWSPPRRERDHPRMRGVYQAAW